jgi:dolichol-phosphate mannosyltransferase
MGSAFKKPRVTVDRSPPGPEAGPSGFLLSLVVPCFNEQDVIKLTYQRLVQTLTSEMFDLQIVFVDDGSRDGTGEILAQLASHDPRVEVVTFIRNFGHQAAVSAGLRHADGDVTAVIDADLQDPPEVILEFMDRWRLGYDVVYGIRTKRKESAFKRVAYSVFYRTFRALASIDAPLDAGDFCLIDRKVLDAVNALPEKNRFFRGLRAWAGSRQIGVAYERNSRAAGESKYPFHKLIKLAFDGIFNFSTVPLTMVFYLGMTMALLAFLSLVWVLVMRIFDIPIFGMRVGDVQGFASTILAILLIGGVQLVSIGILGEYVGRIYQEVKARPPYLIRTGVPASEETESSLSSKRQVSQSDGVVEGADTAGLPL